MLPEISLNILDIAQNSLRAGASLIEISIFKNTKEHTLKFIIKDNGCGMDEQQLERVKDPFYTSRTTRKVGLGVPFLIQAAQATGGWVNISSKAGSGTCTQALFHTDHIDCMPLGNLNETILTLICGLEDISKNLYESAQLIVKDATLQTDILYTYSADGNSFALDTRQLREILGGVSFSEPEVYTFLNEYLTENTRETDGGKQ